MAHIASFLSAVLVAIVSHHVTSGQLLATYLTSTGTCISAGMFPNPADCNGFLQCAEGQTRPYIKRCSPGTLFDAERLECLAPESVRCFGRPRSDRIIPGARVVPVPTVYQAVAPQVVTGPNVVVLRLFDPLLRADQCTAIGQQMTAYLRQLVNNMQLACATNAVCQNNLPTFRVDCLTSSGRVIL